MTKSSFLGRGWAFPPTFTGGGGDVETVAAEEDIHQSLQILFGTVPGERVMRDEFGCDLQSLVFEELDQALINSLARGVEQAMLDHEPRIDVDDVEVKAAEPETGVLSIHVRYSVRTTNSRYNLIYPFYLREAAVPGA